MQGRKRQAHHNDAEDEEGREVTPEQKTQVLVQLAERVMGCRLLGRHLYPMPESYQIRKGGIAINGIPWDPFNDPEQARNLLETWCRRGSLRWYRYEYGPSDKPPHCVHVYGEVTVYIPVRANTFPLAATRAVCRAEGIEVPE